MNEKVEAQTQHTAPVDPVFPRFFRNGEETRHKLVGLMAYGLSEEARREWVDDFKGREGRYPTPQELRAYETSWTSSRLDGLKNAAVQVLASYADSIARDIENQALRRALRGGFFRSLAHWLISAIVFSAAVFGLLVALNRAGIDAIETARDLIRPHNLRESALPPADPPVTPAPPLSASAPSGEPQAAPAPRSTSSGAGAPVTPAPRSGR